MSIQETVFFQDQYVLVTNARAVLGGTTYAMSNITSVTTGVVPADRTLGIIISLLGGALTGCCGLVFLISITALLGTTLEDMTGAINSNIILGFFIFLGLVILGLGIFLAIRAKPTYVVRIGSASGETNALVSKDYPYINKVVGAMNQAIIHRG